MPRIHRSVKENRRNSVSDTHACLLCADRESYSSLEMEASAAPVFYIRSSETDSGKFELCCKNALRSSWKTTQACLKVLAIDAEIG